jgi:hypothetical protein
MQKIFADIDIEWKPLSDDHKNLESYFMNVLDSFLKGNDVHPSYLISGVFGQGKTTFLYYILKKSIEKGMLPIFVIARDLFEKINATDYGEVKERIDELIENLKNTFIKKDFSQYKQYIMSMPSESQEKLVDFYKKNYDGISHFNRVILIVDELEDVYKKIKEKAGSDPLRTWLEGKSYLKILALTPSGIYDLGGADESRVIKWNIPPVSIEYVRETSGLSTGKSNALWWLSRGVPRHIIQNFEKLKEISEQDGSYKISEALKSLERIGKEPGRVNAVEVSSLSDHSKIKFLINLSPQKSQPYSGFHITKDLDEGELSNIFQRMFNLTHDKERDLALLMSYYFKIVAMTISDENFDAYIDNNEINEFMNLVLDMLLENEYKKSVVEENMAKLLSIYEKLRSESTLLLTTLITNKLHGISFKEVNKKLPFTISEIRKLFPLPMANPIIMSDPDKVLVDVEGNGKPVCKNDIFMFFASYRDFERYLPKDEFMDDALKEGKCFVILLPEEEFDRYENAIKNPTSRNEQILRWLIENGKVKVVKSPPQFKLFLLSLYGYENKVPYNIHGIAESIRSSQEILLKKKFELYYTGLNELIEENKPAPIYFFEKKPKPKGLDDVWGTSKLTEEDAAVSGLALAFYNVPAAEIVGLISVRELFRTKDKRGLLADIKVGGGLPTLADDLLPRKDKKGNIVDAPSVEYLKDFWSKDERDKLDRLARLLELSEFKKLSDNSDYRRILEAFWRAIRNEFDTKGIEDLKRRLQEVIIMLEFIQKVQKKCKEHLNLNILFDDWQENIVKALDGLKKLEEISFKESLPVFILKLYIEATLDKIENDIFILYSEILKVDSKIEDLKRKSDEIIKYLTDKREILDFISDKVSFENVKQNLENLSIINYDLKLSDGLREIEERYKSIETLFIKLVELEAKLNELKQKLLEHNLSEVK